MIRDVLLFFYSPNRSVYRRNIHGKPMYGMHCHTKEGWEGRAHQGCGCPSMGSPSPPCSRGGLLRQPGPLLRRWLAHVRRILGPSSCSFARILHLCFSECAFLYNSTIFMYKSCKEWWITKTRGIFVSYLCVSLAKFGVCLCRFYVRVGSWKYELRTANKLPHTLVLYSSSRKALKTKMGHLLDMKHAYKLFQASHEPVNIILGDWIMEKHGFKFPFASISSKTWVFPFDFENVNIA